MAARTGDRSAATPRSRPARPGSYGKPPSGYRLPEATRLGPVQLQVAELPRSLDFYEATLGLRQLDRTSSHAILAPHGVDVPLVELRERPGARRRERSGRLGLYHVALLLPDRASLGRFVRHLGEIGAHAAAGDHVVSEAIYLQDPDNLGIEVYADRPRSSWRRVGRELLLATDPVGMDDLVRAGGDVRWTGIPAGTVVGHVHLHVGDLAEASTFYSEALGFDRITWRYPGALFLGAGGYHHHVAVNTWAGVAAIPPAPEDAQLLEWTIELPGADDVEGVRNSLLGAGFAVETAGDGSLVSRDPWGTAVRLRGGTTTAWVESADDE